MIVTSRSEWGAKHGRGNLDPGPEGRIVIHHSYRPALLPTAAANAEIAAVRSIEVFHTSPPPAGNGWAGIGYGFLVAPSGRVYEGRGWEYRGAHAGPVNGTSIGICLLIDGQVTEPTDAMITAVRELIRVGLAFGHLAANYQISGHRDHMPRTCPGDLVYARLQEFRPSAAPVVPHVTPSVISPAPRPPKLPPLNLDKIDLPTREHVDEVVRVRGLSPEAAAVGVAVAEILLRGVVNADVSRRGEVVNRVADALADWLRDRAA